jgi:hypothetical protein
LQKNFLACILEYLTSYFFFSNYTFLYWEKCMLGKVFAPRTYKQSLLSFFLKWFFALILSKNWLQVTIKIVLVYKWDETNKPINLCTLTTKDYLTVNLVVKASFWYPALTSLVDGKLQAMKHLITVCLFP